MSAEKPSTAPTTSVTAPAQSQPVQPDRHRRAGSDSQAIHSNPSASTAKSTASCVLVSAPSAEAANAAAKRPQLGLATSRAMSQSASVASGYARGSSTKIGA